MGTIHYIRPKPTTTGWEQMLDDSYMAEATSPADPAIFVGLEARADADGRRWEWMVAEDDGEGDVGVIVRSGHADSVVEAQALAEAAAAAVLDDAVRYIAGRAA